MNVPRVAHVATVDMTVRFLLMGQLVGLQEEGFEVTAISAPGPWVSEIEDHGIRHIPWKNATRSWSPTADARAFRELLTILRRERFDLVHTHNPKPGAMGRIAARLAGTPCVINTVHGLYAVPEDRITKKLAIQVVETIAARFSDTELYQSREDYERARRLRMVPPKKAVLLGNGADLNRFRPDAVASQSVGRLRRELGLRPGSIVVGTVGRLVAEKGYRELFAAARQIDERLPQAVFLIVGEVDPAKPDSLSPEEISAAPSNCLFVGWRTDVETLLAVMDVFVLPSWREGVPRSAIEAAGMGKAMVLTDIRGCREVARNGIEALLVPARDPGRLAAAIEVLLGDRTLRDRLGAAAHARTTALFDEAIVVKTVCNTTRDLLADKGIASHPGDFPLIRRARRRDLPAVARLHRERISTGFLPMLGDRFLRHLYAALAADPDAVVLVADGPDGVTGFASGVVSVRRFYRRFYARRGLLAATSALPQLAHREVRKRVREVARYPGTNGTLPDAELLSVAVAGNGTGAGVGRALAQEVVADLGRRGVTDVKVVVGASNSGANEFYGRLGWNRVAALSVHEGTPSNVWVRSCI